MKVIRLMFLVLLMQVGGISFVYSAEPAEFNVASYNLRQLNEGDSLRGDGWNSRGPVIAQLVRFHEFNIFGTQEGFKRQLDELKELLPGYEYTGVARDDGKESGEHSAIFYDTAMFELLDHGDFWLSETPDRPGLGWDAACVRICSWGKFRHKPSGRVFQFFNLHLDHVGTIARVEGVRLVQRKIRELGMDLPTFLTGDFNVDQTHEMYAVLTASDFLLDSFHTAEFVYALNGTFNSYHTDGFTDSRIDHIMHTADVSVKKYGVLTDTYRTPTDNTTDCDTRDFPEEMQLKSYCARVPSDHFPIMARVILK